MTKAAIIGWPIDHSRSPLIYQSWLDTHRIAGSYERIAVKPGEVKAFMSDFAANGTERGLVGFNVTIPHKVEAFELANEPDESARVVGAANLVWREGGKSHCANTDGIGFMAHLDQSAPGWKQGRSHVLLLGAGGAARSILYAFITAGVNDITVVNRTDAGAEKLVGDLATLAADRRVTLHARSWADRSAAAAAASVIVNTTSLGMKGIGSLDLDLAKMRPGTVVADIVYVPLATELLADARANGLIAVDGLGMLLHQAVPCFERYWGVRPSVTDDLRDRLVADIEGH